MNARVKVFHSHYIPLDAPRIRKQEQAACGLWLDPWLHTMSPTCESCKRFMDDKDKRDAEIAASLERID